MRATPVGSLDGTRSRSTLASSSPARASAANGSSPTAPIIRTRAPSRAAATAWFAPFPPGNRSKVASVTVSPGWGSRSHRATRSRLMLPTTVRETLGGKRAQVVDRAVQEVLAQVEETRPKRPAVGRVREAGRRGKTFECPNEHGQLQVGVGDTGGRSRHAGATKDVGPLDDLTGTGLPVPGPAFGLVGLQFEQEAPERPLQSGKGCLHALGGAPERGFAFRCSTGLRLALRPALEQAAERECGDLARRQRAHEFLGGRIGHTVGTHEACPAVAVRLGHLFFY